MSDDDRCSYESGTAHGWRRCVLDAEPEHQLHQLTREDVGAVPAEVLPGDDSVGTHATNAQGPALTTRDLIEVRNATWSIYLGHVDPAVGDEGRPYFRVGQLAFCPVKQLLWRAGVPPTVQETEAERVKKEGKFERGNRIEREVVDTIRLAGLLLDQQIPLWDEELEIKGHADVLWGGAFQTELGPRARYWSQTYKYAVQSLQETLEARAGTVPVPVTLSEIKSSHSYAVRKMRKEGPAIWHRYQLGGYRLLAERHPDQLNAREVERFEFVILDPDGSPPITFEADDNDVAMVEDRVGQLLEAWHSGNWPSCRCGLVPGMEWEAKRCEYLNPEDPSECCGNTLLDRLTASVEATAAAS